MVSRMPATSFVVCRGVISKAFSDRHPGVNRDSNTALKSTGLFAFHSYSVLRAVETRGKRFLVLRNPWGNGGGVSGSSGGWAGPWSNGSREWTQEWMGILPVLGHSFGDDGRFVMECE